MAQVSMTVRMDAALKARFDELRAEFGMSSHTAMNIFARKVVQECRIPFEAKAPKEKDSNEGLLAFKVAILGLN